MCFILVSQLFNKTHLKSKGNYLKVELKSCQIQGYQLTNKSL